MISVSSPATHDARRTVSCRMDISPKTMPTDMSETHLPYRCSTANSLREDWEPSRRNGGDPGAEGVREPAPGERRSMGSPAESPPRPGPAAPPAPEPISGTEERAGVSGESPPSAPGWSEPPIPPKPPPTCGRRPPRETAEAAPLCREGARLPLREASLEFAAPPSPAAAPSAPLSARALFRLGPRGRAEPAVGDRDWEPAIDAVSEPP